MVMARRFDEGRVDALIPQANRDGATRLGEGAVDVATFDLPAEGEVVSPFRVKEGCIVGKGGFGVDDRVEWLVFDVHEFGRVGRAVEVVTQNHGHGIAHMHSLADSQRIALELPIGRLLG